MIVNGDEFENIEIASLTPEEQARLANPPDSSPLHHPHNPHTAESHPLPSGHQGAALQGGPLSMHQQGDPLGVVTDLNRNVGKSSVVSGAVPPSATCDIIITDADISGSSGDMLRDMVKNKVSLVHHLSFFSPRSHPFSAPSLRGGDGAGAVFFSISVVFLTFCVPVYIGFISSFCLMVFSLIQSLCPVVGFPMLNPPTHCIQALSRRFF